MSKLNFLTGTLALVALFQTSPTLAIAGGLDLNALQTASIADLKAAKADADSHNDLLSSECYDGLLQYVSAHPITAPTINVVGVASAFQAGRDAVKLTQAASAQGLLPVEIVQACGPLALDVQNDLGKAAGGLTVLGLKLPF